MKAGDLVMYKHNPLVKAIVLGVKKRDPHSGGMAMMVDLLQVAGLDHWPFIRSGLDPRITADDWMVVEDDEQLKEFFNRQIS